MPKKIISIISAISDNRAIGKDNKLLWDIPEDMQRFRETTKGHPVIMGRKTFESIGRVLPQRLNIIISRDKSYSVSGALVVSSLNDAIKEAEMVDTDEIFIIGGGQIYAQAMPIADKLYLTIVHAEFVADSFFPDYNAFKKKVYEKDGQSGGFKYTFLTLEK